MASNYFLLQIGSPSIQAKLILNMLIGTLHYIANYSKSNRQYNRLIRDARRIVSKSQHSDLVKKVFGVLVDLHNTNDDGRLKSGRPSNDWSGAVLETLQYSKKHDIDQIYHMIYEPIITKTGWLLNPLTENDRTTIISILKSSPSAMDIALNHTGYNPVLLLKSMLTYYIKAVLAENKKRELIAGMDGTPMNDREALEYVRQLLDFSNIINESPIIKAFRSAMVNDYYNGTLVPNNYSKRFINDITKPKLKED
jgi:hypothetical protein